MKFSSQSDWYIWVNQELHIAVHNDTDYIFSQIKILNFVLSKHKHIKSFISMVKIFPLSFIFHSSVIKHHTFYFLFTYQKEFLLLKLKYNIQLFKFIIAYWIFIVTYYVSRLSVSLWIFQSQVDILNSIL